MYGVRSLEARACSLNPFCSLKYHEAPVEKRRSFLVVQETRLNVKLGLKFFEFAIARLQEYRERMMYFGLRNTSSLLVPKSLDW